MTFRPSLLTGGELGRRSRLAAAVGADHEDHRRGGSCGGRGGPAIGPRREQGFELGFEGLAELGLAGVLARPGAEGLEDAVRGGDADVGQDEGFLEPSRISSRRLPLRKRSPTLRKESRVRASFSLRLPNMALTFYFSSV
jgi:hypothetical protein